MAKQDIVLNNALERLDNVEKLSQQNVGTSPSKEQIDSFLRGVDQAAEFYNTYIKLDTHFVDIVRTLHVRIDAEESAIAAKFKAIDLCKINSVIEKSETGTIELLRNKLKSLEKENFKMKNIFGIKYRKKIRVIRDVSIVITAIIVGVFLFLPDEHHEEGYYIGRTIIKMSDTPIKEEYLKIRDLYNSSDSVKQAMQDRVHNYNDSLKNIRRKTQDEIDALDW